MKKLIYPQIFVLFLAASLVPQAHAQAEGKKVESSKAAAENSQDRVLIMMRAVFLDALNDRVYRGRSLGSYHEPFDLGKGYTFYLKYRLTELPQQEASEVRVFEINEVKVKFKGDEFVREEVRFGYKLKYFKETGKIKRWRETSGWKPIEEDPFFGKNPKIKNFLRKS